MRRVIAFYRRSMLSRLVSLYLLLAIVGLWFTLAGELRQLRMIGFETMLVLRAVPIVGFLAVWIEAVYQAWTGLGLIEVSG